MNPIFRKARSFFFRVLQIMTLRLKLVTLLVTRYFSLRVIICETVKKKGRAFRNIGFKYTQFSTVKSALLLSRFHILSLIRSFTVGSGTSFLLRWSLQTLNLSSLASPLAERQTAAQWLCALATCVFVVACLKIEQM